MRGRRNDFSLAKKDQKMPCVFCCEIFPGINEWAEHIEECTHLCLLRMEAIQNTKRFHGLLEAQMATVLITPEKEGK